MEAVVQGVIKTLVASPEVAGSSLGRVMGFENLLDGMADAEVGPVHVTSDHKQASDRQMVMGDVCKPESFGLRVESSEEGQNRSAGSLRRAEDLTHGIWILGIHTPVAGEEGPEACRMRHHTQEIVPTDVLTPGFGDGDVHQVAGPGDGTEAEQNSQVMIEA